MKAHKNLFAIAALLSLCVPPASAQEESCEGWDAAWNPSLFRSLTAEIVTACIRSGQDPNVRDHTLAAFGELPGPVTTLLTAGADPNARTINDETPLHPAAAHSTSTVIAALLAGGASVDPSNEDGETPLHRAAAENPNVAVIELLLEAGADPNARASGGRTPLHAAAARNPNPAVIAALVAAGADVRAWGADSNGIRWSMSSNPDNWTPLHEAAAQNRSVAALDVLLESGADVVFPLLLELGADPTVPDDEGRTPLDLARNNNALQGIEIVRRYRGSGGGGSQTDVNRSCQNGNRT